MAIVRKTAVLQVRCLPEDLAAFEQACALQGVKATERIRRFMLEEADGVQRSVAAKAKYEASKAIPAPSATSVPSTSKKSPVGPIRQPQSLSERRKAEKAAKEARRARKEDRY
jgi:hypothetical protein